MRKALTTILLTLSFFCNAQKKTINGASVLSYDAGFNLTSATSASYSVEKVVLVNSEDGVSAASLMCYDDDYRTLSSFSAVVAPQNGSKPVKVGLKDVRKISGSGQVDNYLLNVWVPSAQYPFTVTMRYTVSYRKAVPVFPFFMPVEQYGTDVRSSSYTLTVPQGFEIKWVSSSDPSVYSDSKGKSDCYKWTFQDIQALVEEPMMPPVRELIPYVYAGPQDFAYLGTKGSQRTWEDLASWNASLFPSKAISDGLRSKIISETQGKSDLEKLRYVYDYLRSNTRYVSIQLGIGGFAPASPASVEICGYGDCKALTFFAHSLLEIVGVKSSYVVLNTDQKDFVQDFPSIGQSNHAMLCVPVANDTVWVECTNPAFPLGYRHEDIAGHQVLVVGDEERGLVRVPSYPDSLSVIRLRSHVSLADDGSASLECEKTGFLNEAEPMLNIGDWDKTIQIGRLTMGFKAPLEEFAMTRIADNIQDYDGCPGYVPYVSAFFHLSSRKYASLSGDRLFVPAIPFGKSLEIKRSERVHDFVINHPETIDEETRVTIPKGYKVEALPEFPSVETPYITMRGGVREEGEEVVVHIVVSFKPGHFSRESYADFREQARALNRIYTSSIVLVKK